MAYTRASWGDRPPELDELLELEELLLELDELLLELEELLLELDELLDDEGAGLPPPPQPVRAAASKNATAA